MTEALVVVVAIAGIAVVGGMLCALFTIFGPACTALGWALRRAVEDRFPRSTR